MRIYLDNHATTRCDPIVVEAMLPFFTESYGNPSSSIHKAGKSAALGVETARQQVVDLIGAAPNELIFTSGATESNNLAIMGLIKGNTSPRHKIVTSSIEHKSILETCKEAQKQNYKVKKIGVDRYGLINLDEACEAINENTLFVSIQAANNEIGTIQNIRQLANIAHDKGAIFHTDAAQAAGKTHLSIDEWDVDLLSLSSHKLYGPKGMGALYIRGGPRGIPIEAIILGGGQEKDLRSGTLNVPGIVGFGMACELCHNQLDEEAMQIQILRDLFEYSLSKTIPEFKVNGAVHQRLPGNSNITLPSIDAEALIANLPELDLSVGSACTSGAPEPSHVLLAIGLSRDEAYSTFRVGIGRFTTEEEIIIAVKMISDAYNRLKNLELTD